MLLFTTKYRILFSLQVVLEKLTATLPNRLLLGESFTIKTTPETEKTLANYKIAHRFLGDRWVFFQEVQPQDDTQTPKRFKKDEPKIKPIDGTRLRFFLELTNTNIVNSTTLKTMNQLGREVFYFSNKTGKKVGGLLYLNQDEAMGINNSDRKTKAEIGLSATENPFAVIDIFHEPASVATSFRIFSSQFISNEALLFQLFFKKA